MKPFHQNKLNQSSNILPPGISSPDRPSQFFVTSLVAPLGTLQGAIAPWVALRFPGGLFSLPGAIAPGLILTIDDGLSSRTGELLDLLDHYQARATFFLHTDSFQQANAPELLRRMVATGHTIGNHMPQDIHSRRLDPATFEREFHGADATLRQWGIQPDYFRAAGGLYSPAMVAVVRRAGYWPQCVMASFLPWDTHIPAPQTYAAMVIAGARPGAIAVFHDGEQQGRDRLDRTFTSLAQVLATLQRRGLPVQPLPPKATLISSGIPGGGGNA